MRNVKQLSIMAALTLLPTFVQAQMQMPMPTPVPMPMPAQAPAAGQPMPMPMPGQPPAGGQAIAAPVPVRGEITRVDTATGRLGIRHEPIPNLDMGAMNMLVRVADPAMLTGIAVGDQVIFEAARVDGQITVVKLSKAPTP